METVTIIIANRTDLNELSKKKTIKDIGMHDLNLSASLINSIGGIVFIDNIGTKSTLKDRYGIL